MRVIMLGLTAVAIGFAALPSAPASAQVGVEVGVPGVGVRIGDPDYRYRERRRIERERDYNVGRRGDRCRSVTVQRERRDGTVVSRTERRCD
jgi:hypothetical protein